MTVHLCEYDGIFQSLAHHFVNQRALFASAVLMVAHAHHHYFGMSLQAGYVFLGRRAELQYEEFHRRVDHRYERYGVVREYREHVVAAVVGIEVNDVFHSLDAVFGQFRSAVYVVGRGVCAEAVGCLFARSVHNHHRHAVASHVSNGCRGAALGVKPVERRCLSAGYEHVSGAARHVIYQMSCHGNLGLGLFAERYAYGVAYSVGKQRAYSDGAFYASVLTFAGLCHSEMQRIVHVFSVHAADEQAHRAHHDHGVGRLDGYHHVVELLLLAYTQKLHAALHDAFGRVAVARHDAIGQRTVVHSYAYGRVVLAADVEERHEARLYLLQFGGILLVGVFQFLECPGRIYIVSGIHAHLFGIERGHVCHVRIEVHVCHERRVVTFGAQRGVDVLQVLRLACALCGESHELASRLYYAFGLKHACLGVVGVCGSHRLHAYRVVTPYCDASGLCDGRFASFIVE